MAPHSLSLFISLFISLSFLTSQLQAEVILTQGILKYRLSTIHLNRLLTLFHHPPDTAGHPNVTLDSMNFPNISFSGPLCAGILRLTVLPGCVLNSTLAALPPVVYVPASALVVCSNPADIIAQLPQKTAADPETVVVFGSPEITVFSPWNLPLGDPAVWQHAVGYGLQLVDQNADKAMLVAANGGIPACVTNDIGAWSSFYTTPSCTAYIVIITLLFVGFTAPLCYRLVLSVRGRQFLPSAILSSAILMSLGELFFFFFFLLLLDFFFFFC